MRRNGLWSTPRPLGLPSPYISTMNTQVLIPIEVPDRELDWKLALAARLSRQDITCTLGPSPAINALAWLSHNFVYVGDDSVWSFHPSGNPDASIMERIHRNGGAVVSIDEEGDAIYGNVKAKLHNLIVRDQTRFMSEGDQALYWGKWQFAESHQFSRFAGLRAVTGHPRLDIAAGRDIEYRKAASRVDKWVSPRDYILINTNFSFVNGVRPTGLHIQTMLRSGAGSDLIYRTAGTALKSLIGAFNLINTLATTFPDRDFVIRPHPTENSNAYRDLCAWHRNVHLEPNGRSLMNSIRDAKAMIHFGCTTGVESLLAGIPTLAMAPDPSLARDETRFLLGKTSSSVAEAVDITADFISGAPYEQDVPSEVASLVDNFNHHDSMERVCEAVFKAISKISGIPKVRIREARMKLAVDQASQNSRSVRRGGRLLGRLRRYGTNQPDRHFLVDRSKWRGGDPRFSVDFVSSYANAIGAHRVSAQMLGKYFLRLG